jgi:tetratricopeptide (TPR) repeat protein
MNGAQLAPRGQRAAAGTGAAVALLFGWWALREGGTTPGPLCAGALALVAALVVAARRVEWARVPRPARWALCALALFTAWSFLSIAWAGARGDAWEAADRALVYLVAFTLFAALPWTDTQAVGVLVAFVLATTLAGTWALGDAIAGSGQAVQDGRLAGPVGYENATAALMLTAFWPAVLLAARRSSPLALRGLLLAAAGFLLGLAVLAQSRGTLLAGAVSLVLAIALSPERVRVLAALSAVTLTTLLSLPALLDVYAGGGDQAALIRAAVAMTVSSALLLAAGLASGRLDRRLHAPAGRLPLHLPAIAATLLLAAAVWTQAGETRLAGGAASGRYDFWRVAAGQFADAPLTGAGAGNFTQDYARERKNRELPLYPHSVVWGTLGQTGIVGAGLLACFFAAAVAGLRRVRAVDAGRYAIAVAAFVPTAAWLAHASVDWLWEVPAVTAPAFALLGLIAGLGFAAGPRGDASRSRRARTAAIAVLAGLAAVSLALPALAARETERAVAAWERDPDAARRALDRAHTLDPLSARADVIAGVLARRDGDLGRARQAFTRALARDPGDWYAQAELALVALGEGRRAAAAARLVVAARLNPLEPAIAEAGAAVRQGVPVPAWVEQRLAGETVSRPIERRSLDCRPLFGIGTCPQEPDR